MYLNVQLRYSYLMFYVILCRAVLNDILAIINLFSLLNSSLAF